MKPIKLLLLICAVVCSVRASDDNLENPELKNAIRQYAEQKRQISIENLLPRDCPTPCCGFPSTYTYEINKLIPDHGRMAEQRDCIDKCCICLIKNKCTFLSAGGCCVWGSAATLLGGLGLIVTSTGMYLWNLPIACVCTCDTCTGTCCQLAYIGASVACVSACTGSLCLAALSDKTNCLKDCDRDALNYYSDPRDLPNEETPLFPEARKEVMNRVRGLMRENV